MSQRQIIQGEKRCILCLHRGRRGSMLCFLCSLQFSTSTRNPGCSSSKRWQTWQPARRTLSSCKTQVRKLDRCRFLFPSSFSSSHVLPQVSCLCSTHSCWTWCPASSRLRPGPWATWRTRARTWP